VLGSPAKEMSNSDIRLARAVRSEQAEELAIPEII
jgi:hypothetical protein